MELNLIQKFCIWVLPVLFAVTVHEVAHGWVAKQCGDPTASALGRLTLNPLKHLDLVGSIIVPGLLLLFGGFVFGWAKPVPIRSRYFKHAKRDMALVALAGPSANALMAFGWAGIAKVGMSLTTTSLGLPMALMGLAGIQINLCLCLFNLLPIPPLDGSRIITPFLPSPLAYAYDKIEPWGFSILILLIFSGTLSLILDPLFSAATGSLWVFFGIPAN